MKRNWDQAWTNLHVRVTRKQAEHEAQAAQAVINNYIIIQNTMPYLDYSSIRCLASTSKILNTIVRTNKNFLERSKFVFDESISPQRSPFQCPKDLAPKSLTIHLGDWGLKTELPQILRLVPNVNSIEIWSTNFVYGTEVTGMLIPLLQNCSKVKELTIDVRLFEHNEVLNNLLKNIKTQEILKNLDSLSLTYLEENGFSIVRHPDFASFLSLIASLSTMLTTLKFHRVLFWDVLKVTGNATIMSILQKNSRSLRSLTLDYFLWESDPIPSIPFESLQELCLVFTDLNCSRGVRRFLTEIRPLRSLELDIRYIIGLSEGQFQEALFKHYPTLKIFHLTWELPNSTARLPLHHLILQPDPQVGPLTFSFLRNFEALEELKLHQSTKAVVVNEHLPAFPLLIELQQRQRDYDLRGSVSDILSYLPDGVERINLGGAIVRNRISHQLGIIKNLRRFDNLQSLNLVQCPGSIDDSILAFICSQMNQLKELGFSHCNELTDFGITGKRKKLAIHDGLNSLTGLRKLKILCCDQLTRRGFLNTISFPDLRKLTLTSPAAQLDHDFYAKLVCQNKILEVLEIRKEVILELPKLKNLLKSQSPLFRRLKFMELPPQVMMA